MEKLIKQSNVVIERLDSLGLAVMANVIREMQQKISKLESDKPGTAEDFLDSFIIDVEQSDYNCPHCGDKESLDKIVDLKEAKTALENLQNYNALP